MSFVFFLEEMTNENVYLWEVHLNILSCFSPQVACMQLINALVTSPDDLDFRIHLRNEFLRCGLRKILPVSHGLDLNRSYVRASV